MVKSALLALVVALCVAMSSGTPQTASKPPQLRSIRGVLSESEWTQCMDDLAKTMDRIEVVYEMLDVTSSKWEVSKTSHSLAGHIRLCHTDLVAFKSFSGSYRKTPYSGWACAQVQYALKSISDLKAAVDVANQCHPEIVSTELATKFIDLAMEAERNEHKFTLHSWKLAEWYDRYTSPKPKW
ncbi:MAG: hypothetical protein JSS65_07060 [Armatimonadetes bacterium]|nr:hypothetical protein [Armatimonadota bacterium]